ncbi:Free methionine-R-sulfoxide reductase [Ceratocystis lukuohia]|uniref:Free methionine-R-sulfoxide reductase n=1 Tax=Ceratocystis lukuohia TaxID=2019550 RepID=A0ABR4MUB1_9PEZI
MLWHAYKSISHPSTAVNWAGFYVIDPAVPKGNQLILGPFQGKTACQIIPFGRGVCGTAAATQMVQTVPDVNAFKGHIACDGETLSEIVVPIVASGVDGSKRLVGLIDVDSTALSTFNEVDEKYLVQFAQQLADGCDWPLNAMTVPHQFGAIRASALPFSLWLTAKSTHSSLRIQHTSLAGLRLASSMPTARKTTGGPAAVSASAAVAKILAYPESRVNPPLTTLPPVLSLPEKTNITSKASYYMGMAKGYLAFYKTGLKSVFAAKKMLNERRAAASPGPMPSPRAVTTAFATSGMLPANVTRADWLFARRVQHDTIRIPIFGLILLVCGELTPLIALYIQGIMPYTCRLPTQLHKDMAAAEARRAASFVRLAPILPTGLCGAYLPSNAGALARRHILSSLHLMPALLDRIAGELLAPLYWRLKGIARLRFLAVDDSLLRRDGVTEALSDQELKLACVERGLAVTDVPLQIMRDQLRRWLVLSQTTGPAEQRAEEAQKRIAALLTTRIEVEGGTRSEA